MTGSAAEAVPVDLEVAGVHDFDDEVCGFERFREGERVTEKGGGRERENEREGGVVWGGCRKRGRGIKGGSE